MPVDAEPEPFWEGKDETERIAEWKRRADFDKKPWGTVQAAGRLNGSSGEWLTKNVLEPLGVKRSGAWITDALDTYRSSNDVAKRIVDTYLPFAAPPVNAPIPSLADHPSEDDIVDEALKHHRQRLVAEIDAAHPDKIITLGNAALRVMRDLLEKDGGSAAPMTLSYGKGYGTPVPVRIGGRSVTWWPLAHPAAPKQYQEAHATWMKRSRGR